MSLTKFLYKTNKGFYKIFGKGITKWEKSKIAYFASKPKFDQPVFIIGAPRTGSTILFQLLSSHLNISYPNNLIDAWSNNFFFGFWLSNKFYGDNSHNSNTSNYGNTLANGLNAPSENGDFWYRWLPRCKHFIDANEISKDAVKELHDNVFAVINYLKRPLLFKNLNAGQRIRLITQFAPDAKFIFIRRNPLYTAQSIIKAKRKLGIPDNRWWSIMPSNVIELEKLPCFEQVAKQIYYLEKQILEDKRLIKERNFIEIWYEDLTNSPRQVLHKLHDFIGKKNPLKSLDVQMSIIFSTKQDLKNDEFKKLKIEIENLNWQATNVKQRGI